MKVERLDVFDFKITLTQEEFELLRPESDEAKASVEAIIAIILGDVINELKCKLG